MNSDFILGMDKAIDAAKGIVGTEYPPYIHNTDVTKKLDELTEAIAEGGGGGGGGTQIQSDWNQSDNSKVDFIKNKPTIPAAQVQADWNESDSSSMAYIANKPSVTVFTDVTDTLTAGSTSITLQNAAITTTSTIDIYTDPELAHNSVTVATGSVTITFDAQQSDVIVKVRVS